MRLFRNFLILGSVFSLSIARAYAIQISLSDDSIDRYFQILEQYVLPLMVVSTVVLFCGYLASRIFHRTVSRRQDGEAGRSELAATAEYGTEAFLRELKATPPIEDSEPRHEPKIRAPHPLLRRRHAAARQNAARQEDMPEAATPGGVTRPAAATVEPVPTAKSPARDAGVVSARGHDAGSPKATPLTADNGTDGKKMPSLQAAFRRSPQNSKGHTDPAGRSRGSADDAGPVVAPRAPDVSRADISAGEGPESGADDAESLRKPAEQIKAPESVRGDRARTEPTLATHPNWQDEPEGRTREEPTIAVVQALKTGPSSVPPSTMSPTTDAVKARAGEIVDSLDYIASVLQQGSVLLAERLKQKQGLSLDEVRGLRVSGYVEPQNALEDLRKLGGDAAQEVLAGFSAVAGFNNIVRRLEQMAESEPLDEGWNDLIRSRISETIFAVGQVRKTLGIYRRSLKKPANTGTAS